MPFKPNTDFERISKELAAHIREVLALEKDLDKISKSICQFIFEHHYRTDDWCCSECNEKLEITSTLFRGFLESRTFVCVDCGTEFHTHKRWKNDQ